MKKHLYLIVLFMCMLFTACGASAKFASGLKTDAITVYEIGTGGKTVITNEDMISDLAASADTGSWKKLSKPADQISASPAYALDFGNGFCIGMLGDGYILVGTQFEYLSADYESYRLVDGTQYQVPISFTDLLKEIIMNDFKYE